MLELKNLDSGYDFLQVLWDVSLSVNEGELVALIGPNGAGKSTTLRTVAGLVKPMGGDVLLMASQLQTFPRIPSAEMVSVMSQSP